MSEQFIPTTYGWRLSGDIDYQSVVAIREAGEAFLEQASGKAYTCELSSVGHINTAALALLLCWYRKARDLGITLTYEGVPGELRAIAEMSDLSQLLDAPAPA